jgi:hypothetical protein
MTRVVDAQCATDENEALYARLGVPSGFSLADQFGHDYIGTDKTQQGAPDGLGGASQVLGQGVPE